MTAKALSASFDRLLRALMDGLARAEGRVRGRVGARADLDEPARLLARRHWFARDLEGRIVRWSEGASRFYGWTPQEAIGRSTSGLLKTELSRPPGEVEAELVRCGEWEGGLVRRRRDGSMVAVASHWTLQTDTCGRLVVLEVDSDISGLKRGEEELAAARSRIAAILEAITDCYCSLDRSWRYTYINPAAERYFARAKESMLGRTPWELFPDTVGSDFEKLYRSTLERGEPRHFEVFSPITRRWAETYAYPSASGLEIYFRDITERRRLQSELERRVAELETVLDILPTGVAIAHDPGGTDIRVNAHLAALLGVAPGENVSERGPRGGTLPYACFRDGKEISADELPLVVALRRRIEVRAFDMEIRTDDGRLLHVIANAAPLFDEQGGVRGGIAVFNDVSELRRMQLALVDDDRRKDEFLAMLSHELRNPLAPIRNATRLLRILPAADPRGADAREVIDRQVRYMARLVDDLLDVSRITRGQIELRKEVVAIGDVVQRAVETVRPAIDRARQTLAVSLPAEPVRVDADPTRLVQVFANLLSNASKFTPPEGSIAVAVERRGDRVVVRVRDDGIGMRADILGKIFDLFVQGPRSLDRVQGGLGIGLTLAKRLAELHGGSIAAFSDGPGRGSEFAVTLPALRAEPVRVGGPGNGSARSRALRVLVAEDNPDAARSLALLLELSGHEVRTAPDGLAAIEAEERFSPDVALLDIGLPALDGYEVAARLRAARGSCIVLVAVSGYGRSEDKERARVAGFDHHLTKPVDPEMLEALLADVASAGGGSLDPSALAAPGRA